MTDRKQTNTQEMLGSLHEMNSQLRSIRHCCNFVVLFLMLCFLAFVWQLMQLYESMLIEL